MRKKYKSYKKSMRVLIVILISLICVNGALMVGTLIASATINPASAQDNAGNNFVAKKASEMQVAKFEAKVAAATAANTQEVASIVEETAAPTTTNSKPSTTTAKPKNTTTTTTVAAPAPAPTTTTPSANEISSLKNSVTPTLVSAFDQLAFSIVINANSTYLGYFSTSKHSIEMRSVSVSTFRHEMGHFLDVLKNMPSRSTEFVGIYESEKSLYTGTNGTYITSSAQEYFAQSYRNYLEDPTKLMSERPATYAFVAAQITNISSTDISRTYGQYSWAW